MTDTMIEKMARAIALSDGMAADELDRMIGNPLADPMPEYTINARAALLALRDGVGANAINAGFETVDVVYPGQVHTAFLAILNHVLQEGEKVSEGG